MQDNQDRDINCYRRYCDHYQEKAHRYFHLHQDILELIAADGANFEANPDYFGPYIVSNRLLRNRIKSRGIKSLQAHHF